MNLNRRIALASSLALTLGLLTACGGGGGSGNGTVRLVNATSEYPSLDLYQSTTQVTANVASFAGSTYASLGAGTYTFDVKASGSGTTSSSSSRTLSKDVASTLIAYTTGGTLVTALLTESEPAPTSGSAKFRLFNTASVEAGTVDVYLTSGACSALPSTASATAINVSTFSGYVEVTAAAAGTAYHVCITGSGDKTDLRLDIPSLTLTDQQIATLVLARSTGGVLLHGLVMNQQGTVTAARNTALRIRALAAAATTKSVNATVNSVALAASAVSPSIGAYKLVPAGTLTATLTVDGKAVTSPTLSGTAGADLTLIVAGTAAAPTVTLINDDNTPSTSTSKPVKLRLVNVLNGIGGPASLTDDFSPVADGVTFGSASTTANVASSAALARLDVTFAGTTLCSQTLVTLTSGRVYSLFLTGDAGAQICTLRADR